MSSILNCKRAKVFHKKGLTCVNCGVKGMFFALEKDKGGGLHLDLYGLIDKEEVLLTIDHIVPKSKGGVKDACKSLKDAQSHWTQPQNDWKKLLFVFI